MSQVNKVPVGLQDFLGSQNFGDNPNELARAVVPTVDLTQFFRIYDLKTAGTALQSITGELTFPTIDVPVGEVWMIHSIGFSPFWNTGGQVVTDGCTFVCSVQNTLDSDQASPTPCMEPLEFGARNAPSVTSDVYMARTFDNPWPARGGEKLRAKASDVAVTGASEIQSAFFVRYFELTV